MHEKSSIQHASKLFRGDITKESVCILNQWQMKLLKVGKVLTEVIFFPMMIVLQFWSNCGPLASPHLYLGASYVMVTVTWY